MRLILGVVFGCLRQGPVTGYISTTAFARSILIRDHEKERRIRRASKKFQFLPKMSAEKKKGTAKPTEHPKYKGMIVAAISALKARSGS